MGPSESLTDLLAIATTSKSGDADCLAARMDALLKLGNLLEQHKESLSATQTLVGLLAAVRTDGNLLWVTRAVSIVDQLAPVSAVSTLIDVALADGIAVLDALPAERVNARNDCTHLRCVAIRALGKIGGKFGGKAGDSPAVIPLMSLLNDRGLNYRVRMAAAESLGRLGDAHATAALMDILQNDEEPSIYLRESTAKALGMLGDLRAVDALIEVMNTKKGLRNKLTFLKERAIQALGQLVSGKKADEKVVNNLLLSLKDSASSIRLAAVEALGDLDDPQWIPHLATCLNDSDDMVSLAAIASIYNVGGDIALRALLGLDTLPQFVREEIVTYLDDSNADDEELLL
ncbi:MAG: HEAT repeat domain-containing protein [Vampirovibrionales bacterium]|nr:HEAT repeat domain-containing protein [Vampirovibrionales bacterium]